MNRFEEMNVAEQQEISGGSAYLPVLPVWPVKVIEKFVTVGAVAGGLASVALNALSGK